jgi:hypothetical protein
VVRARCVEGGALNGWHDVDAVEAVVSRANMGGRRGGVRCSGPSGGVAVMRHLQVGCFGLGPIGIVWFPIEPIFFKLTQI